MSYDFHASTMTEDNIQEFFALHSEGKAKEEAVHRLVSSLSFTFTAKEFISSPGVERSEHSWGTLYCRPEHRGDVDIFHRARGFRRPTEVCSSSVNQVVIVQDDYDWNFRMRGVRGIGPWVANFPIIAVVDF